MFVVHTHEIIRGQGNGSFLGLIKQFFREEKQKKQETDDCSARIFLIQTKREEKRKKHARILAISLFVISRINTTF